MNLTEAAAPRRTSLSKTVEQGALLLMTTIGVLIVILALLILFHQNANATKGYLLRTLERDRTQLLRDEEMLNLELAKEQSLEKIEHSEKVQVMVEPKKIQYAR